MRTLSETVSRGSQDVKYLGVFVIGDYPERTRRVKVEIRSDSYDFQCYAWIDSWDGERWNRVHEIHHAAMATPPKLYYQRPGEVAELRDFVADRDALLDMARLITEET